MRILPVLDLMNGLVVRGVAGRRAEYRPVQSRLVASADPVAVACAFRDHFGLTALYVADLDAIAGGEPSLPLYRELRRLGFTLWVDAGIRDVRRADELAPEIDGLVVGLETLAGPAALAEIMNRHDARAVFSLDIKGGEPLCDPADWNAAEPLDVARTAVAAGARRILVLDLARVGVGAGTGTDDFCRRLRAAYPDLEMWAGGGIRGADDLRRLASAGMAAVLVASALHDKTLTVTDLVD